MRVKMAERGSGYTSSHRFYGDFERADTSIRLHMILDITRKEGSTAKGPLESIRNLAKSGDPWVKALHSVALNLATNEQDKMQHEMGSSVRLDSMSIGSRTHGKVGAESAFVNRAIVDTLGYSEASTVQEHFSLKKSLVSPLKEAVLHQEEANASSHPLSRTMKLGVHGPITLPALTRQPSRRMPMAGGVAQRNLKESRTKLLDIADVPTTKKRRKTMDADATAKLAGTPVESPTKKAPPTPTVPEYAAGLGFDTPDVPSTPPVFPALQPHPSISPSPAAPTPSPVTSPPPQPPKPTIPPVTFKQPRLSPTQEQLMIANEMFRESPTLSNDQKRMITSFLSGVTENPHPEQGSVVTVPLTKVERQEPFVDQSGNKGVKVYLIETVFEMNYNTGQWRKLQLKRLVRTELGNSTRM